MEEDQGLYYKEKCIFPFVIHEGECIYECPIGFEATEIDNECKSSLCMNVACLCLNGNCLGNEIFLFSRLLKWFQICCYTQTRLH